MLRLSARMVRRTRVARAACAARANASISIVARALSAPIALATTLPSSSRAFCAAAAAAEKLSEATAGCKVSVHYKGTLEDGTVFDESTGKDPLEFKLGAGEMIPGFDKAVEGMRVGEKKSITLAPADAYGEYEMRAVQEVELAQLPDGAAVGAQLQTNNGMRAVITKIEDGKATVDFNHPLQARRLTLISSSYRQSPRRSFAWKRFPKGTAAHFQKQATRLKCTTPELSRPPAKSSIRALTAVSRFHLKSASGKLSKDGTTA